MKKIFTLLFAVGILTAAANAQPGSRDNRDKPQYDPRSIPQNSQRDNHQYDQKNDPQTGQWDKNNSYSNDNSDRYKSNSFYGRGIEMQIAQINRKFDFQVQRVKNDFFMRRYQKMRTIRSLEEQRQQEIRMVYANSGRNQQYDRGYGSNHHY
jgi:hypothetical protein